MNINAKYMKCQFEVNEWSKSQKSHPEDGSGNILRNFGILPHHSTTSQHKVLWLESLQKEFHDVQLHST